MINILLIEDDPVLGKGLQVNLELSGYRVNWGKSLKDASELYQTNAANLVVLDLNLPDGNGLNFLKKIREKDLLIPVVILTAKIDEASVVEGLQAGANDYVRKPFGNQELLARISSLLRMNQAKGKELHFGELSISLESRKVLFGEQEVELHRREFDILVYFIRHAETVVTRQALLDLLDKDGEIFDRTIDSHISHIRSRFKQLQIQTIQISSVYGVGYRLEKK